jgi:putative sugar O-methyltransferase
MKTSISDNKLYPDVCRRASVDDAAFATFKSDPNYRVILEHVSVEQGERFYKEINNKDILLNINKFKANDILGCPQKFTYDFGTFSPSTLRYMKVLNDILSSWDVEEKSIIEIGAGYGGQYFVMKQISNPKKYSFVDLPDVITLISRYLSTLGANDNVEYIVGSNLEYVFDEEYDLIISNYGICECSESVQKYYIKEIISRSKHGYITHNQMSTYSLSSFIKELKKIDKDVAILPEVPLTGKNNVILVW